MYKQELAYICAQFLQRNISLKAYSIRRIRMLSKVEHYNIYIYILTESANNDRKKTKIIFLLFFLPSINLETTKCRVHNSVVIDNSREYE